MWGIVDTNVGSDLIQMWGQVRYKCGAPVDANVGPGSIQMVGSRFNTNVGALLFCFDLGLHSIDGQRCRENVQNQKK